VALSVFNLTRCAMGEIALNTDSALVWQLRCLHEESDVRRDGCDLKRGAMTEIRSGAISKKAGAPSGAETECERETVLLVEDEAFVREVTSEVLQGAGYRVLVARNAVEAKRLYWECSGIVDLLLTDVVLPGENGRELARRVKEKNPRTRILLMSGYAEQIGLRGGGFEVLAKPFSVEELLRRVEEALGANSARLEKGGSGSLAVACSVQNLGGYFGEGGHAS
jgi:CheY-like chemotaxis protein